MSEASDEDDVAPGYMDAVDRGDVLEGVKTYATGLVFAGALTVASFFLVRSELVWGPGIASALIVLAVAQIGVHLVFFLHLTTAPDNTNNSLALAFGVLIVALIVGGSFWIMDHLSQNMMPMHGMAQMQPERPAPSGPSYAKGVVEPSATASVHAQVAGVVQSISCEVGAQVTAGQLCAKIDSEPYRAAFDKSAAEVAAATALLKKHQANLSLLREALQRREAQFRRGVGDRKALAAARKAAQDAQVEVSGDEAKVGVRQAALSAAEADLGRTNVTSPLQGVVLSWSVEVGRIVSKDSETPLFVVGELATVRIEARVDPKDIGALKRGEEAAFVVDALPNRKFSGVIREISLEGGGSSILLEAPNADLSLKPGMTATISLEAGR